MPALQPSAGALAGMSAPARVRLAGAQAELLRGGPCGLATHPCLGLGAGAEGLHRINTAPGGNPHLPADAKGAPRGSIMRADARDLARHVEPGSVALTVTSPPYRNAIDYGQDVRNRGLAKKEWMRGGGTATTAEYLDGMADIFGEVLVATRPGGFCAIVVGDEVVDGKLIPLPSLIASRIAGTESGGDPAKWRLRDSIVWHKVTAGRNGAGNRCGAFIRRPRPGYFRANIMHEHILVLQKEGGPPPRSSAAGRIPLNRIVKREIANSVWHIAPVPPNLVAHPAPFPEQIPWRLITLLTEEGDLVLDPMNGSGQTTKVAKSLGRRYVGLDVEAEYVAVAKSRLGDGLRLGDSLVPVFHKEAWCDADQSGLFETERADLSANIPGGYRLEFTAEQGGAARGGGAYAYYRNAAGSRLCLVLAASGRLTRLNLGRLGEAGSMLRGALADVPDRPFTAAALGGRLGRRLAGGRQAAGACLGALVRDGLVEDIGGAGGGGRGRRYDLTERGARQRREWGRK